MSNAEPRYGVFLRPGLAGGDQYLLSKFAKSLTTKGGETVLVINCTGIDESHHAYLKMDAIRESDKGVYTLRVPHHFVALIAGGESSKPIGFLANFDL